MRTGGKYGEYIGLWRGEPGSPECSGKKIVQLYFFPTRSSMKGHLACHAGELCSACPLNALHPDLVRTEPKRFKCFFGAGMYIFSPVDVDINKIPYKCI